MTIPRRVLPGTTYLITRRTLQRRFYLQPGPAMNQIYLYALASAAQKHEMLVHAFSCMSNHTHDSITDVRGVAPDFTRDFHRELALAAKQLHGIAENVWSAEKASMVELHGEAAQLDAVRYTILNPVKAGLVPSAAEWPGAISLPRTRRIEVRRPDIWFSTDRPEVVTLELTPPPSWRGTADEWFAWLDAEIGASEREIRKERAKTGKPFLGKRRVLAQRPFDRPRNADTFLPSRNPVLKTSGDGSLMRSIITTLHAWRRAYCEARERWRIDKSVTFPLGTWWVVQRAGGALE